MDSLLSSNAGYSKFSRGAKQLYFSIVAHCFDSDAFVIAESQPSLDHGPLSRAMNQYWKLLEASWLRICKALLNISFESLPHSKRLATNVEPSKALSTTRSKAYRSLGNIFIDKFSQKFLKFTKKEMIFKDKVDNNITLLILKQDQDIKTLIEEVNN